MIARRPWWLWAATASFIGYFCFLNLTIYYSREPLGFAWEVRGSGEYVTRVSPGLPAATAGFVEGDRIVSTGDLAIADANDMNVVNANIPINSETVWHLERNGKPLTVTVAPLRRSWIIPEARFMIALVAFALSLGLGLLVAWRGPTDTSSRIGAWLLASLGCAYLPLFPRSVAAIWRELPQPVAMFLLPAALSSTWSHVLLFAYCARVPKPQLSRRWLLLALLPGIAIVIFVAVFVVLTFYAPARALDIPTPEWILFAGPLLYPAYMFAAALLLLRSARTATDLTDKRRAQTLLAGVACGATGILIYALTLALQQTGRLPANNSVLFVAVMLFCVLPLSFAYAALRHRLFDLRVIVRLGLQYALMRGVILALVPIAVGLLVIDVLVHGDQSLRAVLGDRGWSYAIVAGGTLLTYSQRGPWMTALDRSFFRERYAAQQILREVAEELGRSTDARAASGHVVSRIEAALHPTVVSILWRSRRAAAFSSIASLPASANVPPLVAASSIVKVTRALGRPINLAGSGLGSLPPDDERWVQVSGIELITPVAVDESRDEVLLVLGPRRSEEPYSREDLDLLATIAASLSLLMSRDVPAPATIASHRRLADRYRLEAIIGEGGMGVVYAATDETLERLVAVKLLREEQMRSAEGLARFSREAKAAASLSHPHIVVVHDFGIDESGTPYLVMERLTGRSLRAALRENRRLAADRVVRIMNGVASAIDAAHARGMVHRDLKPENVFLSAEAGDERAKVLDFGIARSASAVTGTATATGVLIGTLPYMAPEQLSGGQPAPAWDVWSLAVIAYELLSGEHPFGAKAGGSGLAITRPPAIRSIAADLPEEIELFFDCALSLDATRRPATAGELASKLAATFR